MKSCGICAKKIANAAGRFAPRAQKQSMILMLSLSLAGQMDSDRARKVAETITRGVPKICHEHIVQAAQYMLAEMVAAGNEISHYDDPKASGRTAYVTDGDIPQHLVAILNNMAEGIVSITARDVNKFLNAALKNYYSSPVWPVKAEPVITTVAQVGQDGGKVENLSEVCGKSEISEMCFSSKAVESSTADDDDEKSTSPLPFMSEDDSMVEDVSDCSSTCSSYQETDDVPPDQYFLVKAEMLMQLFEFCPHCGHKLNRAQLSAAGTAAIVKFSCEQCCLSPSHEKRWESQDRTVAYSQKGTHKGNVAASIAAITTGIRYADLKQWAKQLNLAFFSKSLFKKIFMLTKPSMFMGPNR